MLFIRTRNSGALVSSLCSRVYLHIYLVKFLDHGIVAGMMSCLDCSSSSSWLWRVLQTPWWWYCSCEIMAINVELCSRVILVQVSLGLRVIYINLYVITEERSLNYGNLAEEKWNLTNIVNACNGIIIAKKSLNKFHLIKALSPSTLQERY